MIILRGLSSQHEIIGKLNGQHLFEFSLTAYIILNAGVLEKNSFFNKSQNLLNQPLRDALALHLT